MIFIAAATFDINASFAIEELPSSDFGDTSRRVNRVKTLDQGVAINDGGSSYGDRTFTIIWQTNDFDEDSKMRNMVRNHSLVNVTNGEGCFLAVPEFYNHAEGESTLTLLIKEKVS